MEKDSDISNKLYRKNEKIKSKYIYNSNRLKGNKKILETKIFSPTRRESPIIRSNNTIKSEYSLNYLRSPR